MSDKPSIAELQRLQPYGDHDVHSMAVARAKLVNAAPVLLEIAAAALALGPELVYLQGPLSERLREALLKVRP